MELGPRRPRDRDRGSRFTFGSCGNIDFGLSHVAGLVVLNSLSFCLSVKVLIAPSNLNDILPE